MDTFLVTPPENSDTTQQTLVSLSGRLNAASVKVMVIVTVPLRWVTLAFVEFSRIDVLSQVTIGTGCPVAEQDRVL